MGAKLSFELDAGKILAKLHRGGCQLHDKMLYFNTGITDDANISPEEVDKNKINFDMEGGEYELGIIISKEDVAKLAKQADGLDLDKNKDLAAAVRGVCSDLDKKMQGLSDEKNDEKLKDNLQQFKDAEWKEMFDKVRGQSDEIGSSIQNEEQFKQLVMKQYPDYMKERDKAGAKNSSDNKQGETKEKEKEENKNTPITQNPDEKKTNESVLAEDYAKLDPNQNPVDMATLELANANPDTAKLAKIAKDAPEHAKKAIDQNRDAIKKFMENNMKNACTYLNEYLKVFAGQDTAKVDPKNVQVTYVPEQFADPYKNKKYDKYQIPALTDEEVRQEKIKQLKDMQKTGKTEISFKNMCFKIAYSLDIGK